jgi:hypothetical protein
VDVGHDPRDPKAGTIRLGSEAAFERPGVQQSADTGGDADEDDDEYGETERGTRTALGAGR